MASIARPPGGVREVVKALIREHHPPTGDHGDEHPQDPPIAPSMLQRNGPTTTSPPGSPTKPQSPRLSAIREQHWDTPSRRTGPPRSISYNYSISGSHPTSRANSHEEHEIEEYPSIRLPSSESGEEWEDLDPDHAGDFVPIASPFRGALEYQDPEQREKERELAERRQKRRDSYFHDVFNPARWISDSPKEEHPPGPPLTTVSSEVDDVLSQRAFSHRHARSPTMASQTPSAMSSPLPATRRTKSLSHIERENSVKSPSAPKWGRLRSLLPHIAAQSKEHAPAQASEVVSPAVNITDELIAGGLSTLMLRFWFERDEKGHRRVPLLFHRLRIRISDSLHPLHGSKAVFRIECEYANGAARWVVYRQLKEFLSLHTHYTFANAYNRNIETLPDFPRAGIPYFNLLKERSSDFSRADFARLQRESLENYLIGLIRAVMFHPAGNRLAAFLEISALSIALAQSGGNQYKAGFLRIEAIGNKGSFGKRGTTWKDKKKQKWCAVRESYLVVLEEMGELEVHDVFLLDSDFKIERPTRYYRQGLNLITHPELTVQEEKRDEDGRLQESTSRPSFHGGSSIKSKLSRVFHFGQSESSDRGTRASRASGSRARASSISGPTSGESSEGAELARQITPILDPSTNTNPLYGADDQHDQTASQAKKKKRSDVSKHTFYVENSQMRLKLFARNERQMLQWIAALEKVAKQSHYTGKNRFDSFAPIRLNVAAQWLVDGRDYFWNLSRAIMLAKESIYIHDWWLTPELQLRRPGMDKYRLDRLLERKAKEGVKIYVILYLEVSSKTTPTDSNYAKQRLSALHPNIMVQRSPSHFQTGTFYWAHHEKLCVIDQVIAFTGGLDLCFGRWDTPQHVLIDDPETAEETIWPGKDYSNPRVTDFHDLQKPFEDMYDRSKVPRMPWHDVSMQMVGQPARDLARHFVQRWNFLLRIKNHSRPMPSLVPPPDFRSGELSALGLTGTCELQICRSAGPWSMGTPDKIEHSIQNAYLKAIQMSEHFVYIENQFFITSTVVNEVKVENRIGDALVSRIIRAYRERTPFKVCIVIPLLPGFTFPVDHSDASAIRIILECQNRTLCRGPNSIYARLRKEGIDPDDYIVLFSLRNWAKLRGDVLTTEQVYIHAKVCIVDDRLAIIGSANINERSQRGDRDSEIAAVIRDTDMIDCTMAGEPFKVGRFAHTLRVRLMREHLGVDVDAMYEEDLMASKPLQPEQDIHEWDPDQQQEHGKEEGVTRIGKRQHRTAMKSMAHDAIDAAEQALHGTGDAEAKDMSMLIRKMGIKSKGLDSTAGDKSLREERQTYTREGEKVPGFTSSVVPTAEEKIIIQQRSHTNGNGTAQNGDAKESEGSTPSEARANGELFAVPANGDSHRDEKMPQSSTEAGDADSEEQKAPSARATLRKHLNAKLGSKWAMPTPAPTVDPHGFDDPVCDKFWKDVWMACAVHNTEIYRKVFHAIPDDLVTTWKQYKEFIVHHERLNRPARDQASQEPIARMPSENGDTGVPGSQASQDTASAVDEPAAKSKDYAQADGDANSHILPNVPNGTEKETRTRKTSRTSDAFDQSEREEMERLLEEVRGHLVMYPTRFLEGEDKNNNFLFNADRIMPLPIYD